MTPSVVVALETVRLLHLTYGYGARIELEIAHTDASIRFSKRLVTLTYRIDGADDAAALSELIIKSAKAALGET